MERNLPKEKIPAGYEEVTDGIIQCGDKVWDCRTGAFEDATKHPIKRVDWHYLVIRKARKDNSIAQTIRAALYDFAFQNHGKYEADNPRWDMNKLSEFIADQLDPKN